MLNTVTDRKRVSFNYIEDKALDSEKLQVENEKMDKKNLYLHCDLQRPKPKEETTTFSNQSRHDISTAMEAFQAIKFGYLYCQTQNKIIDSEDIKSLFKLLKSKSGLSKEDFPRELSTLGLMVRKKWRRT